MVRSSIAFVAIGHIWLSVQWSHSLLQIAPDCWYRNMEMKLTHVQSQEISVEHYLWTESFYSMVFFSKDRPISWFSLQKFNHSQWSNIQPFPFNLLSSGSLSTFTPCTFIKIENHIYFYFPEICYTSVNSLQIKEVQHLGRIWEIWRNPLLSQDF